MRAAVEEVERAEGAVGALVNNAGYSLSGAVESVALEDARRRVRDERLRPRPPDAARPPGHAARRLGTDRQRQLDGRSPDVPRRRLVPRLQARGRGAQRCAPVRGAGLRNRRRRDRTRSDPDRVRGDGGRVDPGRATSRTAGSTRPSAQRPPARTTGSSAGGSEADPDTVARTIERALSAKRPRTRYRVTPSAKLVLTCGVSCRDRGWDALVGRAYPKP